MKLLCGILAIGLPIFGMEKDLRQAIWQSDLKKVEAILTLYQNQPQENDSSRLLSAHANINLEHIHDFAQSLTNQKAELKESRNNIHVYKRATLGLASIGTGVAIVGYYFYQAVAQGKSESLNNFLSILVAAGGLAGHGVEQIRLGLGNHDAINAHAKHAAILQLIESAQRKVTSQESV